MESSQNQSKLQVPNIQITVNDQEESNNSSNRTKACTSSTGHYLTADMDDWNHFYNSPNNDADNHHDDDFSGVLDYEFDEYFNNHDDNNVNRFEYKF